MLLNDAGVCDPSMEFPAWEFDDHFSREHRARERIRSQNCGVEAPVRQGATTQDWQRQFKEEQRRRTGWIGGAKWEVIVFAGPINDV